MAFFRKGALVIVCILLFLVILIGNVFLTFGLSLKYENIQSELVPIAKGMVFENMNVTEKLSSDFDTQMELYCQSYDKFVFNQDGYTIVIPCSVIEQGSDAVVDYGIEEFVKGIYYKDYDCSFWDCWEKSTSNKEAPTFLISEKSQSYMMNKFYLSLFAFFLLIALTYFLFESKENFTFSVGILLVVGSLPFLILGKIFSVFVDTEYVEFIAAFFSSASSVFWTSMILGLIVFGVGIGLKFWDLGEWISEKFDRSEKGKRK